MPTESNKIAVRRFQDGFNADDYRIQFSFKYNFSKNFTF